MQVVLEQDPVPIAKIMGAQLRRALTHPDILKTATSMRGSFALRSTTDPQQVTVALARDRMTLTRGIANDAGIIIHIDFRTNDSTKVDGRWRHPLFALKVAKLLKPPTPKWTDAAKRFWELVHAQSGMPGTVKLVCTDDDREYVMGDGHIDVEIYGAASNLVRLLNGSMVFMEGAYRGEIKILASLEHTAVLTEVSKKHMMGELGI
jgi:hypothetical protein